MIFNLFKKISSLRILNNLIKSKFYLFTQHPYISINSIRESKKLLGIEDEKTIKNFEIKFSKLIGDGSSVSFAAGRMGFYSLLKILKIKNGDEIIVCSGTCSVMINAILKLNATPIFTDISEYTLGSDIEDIKKKTTHKTKLIIAQHNFGIPCDIKRIQSFCRLNNIFLLEDCALTLGSKVNGIKVGNFGDAALFSIDHTKPLPVFVGGIIYTKNKNLHSKLQNFRDTLPELNQEKQKAILNKLQLNNRLNNPSMYRFLYLSNIYLLLKIKLGFNSPYLDENYSAKTLKESYYYPSKLPPFLAFLGLKIIDKWDLITKNRISNFNYLLDFLKKTKYSNCIPKIYSDSNLEILPLRLILIDYGILNLEKLLSQIIDVNSSWFKSPVISTNDNLTCFKYKISSCPKSEEIGRKIINLPIEYEIKEINKVL